LKGPLGRYSPFGLDSLLELFKLIGQAVHVQWGEREYRLFREGYSVLMRDFPRFADQAVRGNLVLRDPSIMYLMERGAIATISHPSPSPEIAGPVYLPVLVYVSAGDVDSQRISALVTEALDAFELDLVAELPPEYGSLWKRFWARARKLLRSKEAQDLMRTIEFATKQAVLESTQAEIDLKKAQAMKELISATDGLDGAVIRVGSMLVSREGNRIAAYSMTADEMIRIAEQPRIAVDPRALAEWMQKPVFQLDESAAATHLALADPSIAKNRLESSEDADEPEDDSVD